MENSVSADRLAVRWRKSKLSNPSGSCVELGQLAGGDVAIRNSRHPSGPALICSHAEVAAFLTAAKIGEFDDLYLTGGSVL